MKRSVSLFVVMLVLLSGISYFSAADASASRTPGVVAPFPELKKGDRLTIIAPHPDDETIALGGLIYRARQQHIPVSIIFITNGDGNKEAADVERLAKDAPSMIQLGKERQQEAINATAILGVPQNSLYFLSLPDTGLEKLLSKQHRNHPYTDQLTGQQNTAAYPNSYIPKLSYTGRAAEDALLRAVNDSRPTRVFVTMREDIHRDHWGAGEMTQHIRRRIRGQPRVYSYLVHYQKYANETHTDVTPLVPPANLLTLPWDSISLTPDEESYQAKAIQEYKSQAEPGSDHYSITNFTRPNELVVE